MEQLDEDVAFRAVQLRSRRPRSVGKRFMNAASTVFSKSTLLVQHTLALRERSDDQRLDTADVSLSDADFVAVLDAQLAAEGSGGSGSDASLNSRIRSWMRSPKSVSAQRSTSAERSAPVSIFASSAAGSPLSPLFRAASLRGGRTRDVDDDTHALLLGGAHATTAARQPLLLHDALAASLTSGASSWRTPSSLASLNRDNRDSVALSTSRGRSGYGSISGGFVTPNSFASFDETGGEDAAARPLLASADGSGRGSSRGRTAASFDTALSDEEPPTLPASGSSLARWPQRADVVVPCAPPLTSGAPSAASQKRVNIVAPHATARVTGPEPSRAVTVLSSQGLLSPSTSYGDFASPFDPDDVDDDEHAALLPHRSAALPSARATAPSVHYAEGAQFKADLVSQLRVVSYATAHVFLAGLLTGGLFIMRGVLFSLHPLFDFNITGTADTVLYPHFFYTIPD
ncbi:hypothetical protein EON68_02675, partial [archaeon]